MTERSPGSWRTPSRRRSPAVRVVWCSRFQRARARRYLQRARPLRIGAGCGSGSKDHRRPGIHRSRVGCSRMPRFGSSCARGRQREENGRISSEVQRVRLLGSASSTCQVALTTSPDSSERVDCFDRVQVSPGPSSAARLSHRWMVRRRIDRHYDGTFDPKVAGSIPARHTSPLRPLRASRRAARACYALCFPLARLRTGFAGSRSEE